jgi:hypothetical protein
VSVGEITFATARYSDFFTKFFRVVDEHNFSTPLRRRYSAHGPCRARTNNYRVIAEVKHTLKIKLKLFYNARLSIRNLQSLTSLSSWDYFAGLFYELT